MTGRRCTVGGALTAVAGLGLLHAAGSGAEEFFPIRDENPLLRGFYLPLASDARSNDPVMLTAALTISNTINVESRGDENLFVDGESDTLRISYGDVLAAGWRYRFTVPLIRDGGGFLDTTIDTWHQLFGLPRGERPYYPKNQLDYFYSGNGQIHLDHSQTSFGNTATEAGWFAADDDARTVSLWGGLEAPTGSTAKLTSDGAWDAAVWAHMAQRGILWQIGAEAGVVQAFGDELFAGSGHRAAAFMRTALTRSLGGWSLRAQIDGQTRRVDSELRFLGPSLQLTLGAAHRLRGRWRVEMGFMEDLAVNTAPDIGFFFGIHD